MHTACTVRTRTATKRWTDDAGGAGRNARVIQYLKPGEYQVTVRSMGRSRGRAGLSVVRRPLVDGGALIPGRTMRAIVKAGSAVQYALAIPREAEYRVSTRGEPFRQRVSAGLSVTSISKRMHEHRRR